jgi:uncharacterized protein
MPWAARAAVEDLHLPAPAPVVDEYGLLSSEEVARLDQLVRKIKANSGVELTIYIPSSLRDQEIEDFSIAVAEQWKLGRKKEDKGLLMIVAPRERKMRFEVGYGMEGDLTDAFTRHVLDNGMRPYFKQGRYYEGIVSAISMLQEKIPLGVQPSDLPSENRTPASGAALIFLLVFIVIIFRIISFFGRFGGPPRGGIGRSGYYNSWGGGGFGGGSSGSSWGGGGGGFGGGGSSSSW